MGSTRGHGTSARKSDKPGLYGESYFKHAFAHASIGLAIVGLDGRFIYTNAAYSKITGYSARELKRLKIGVLMFPEDAAANALYRSDMLQGKIPGYVLEKRYIRKDGSLIWVKSNISIAVDEEGRPKRIIGLTEDIDEQHKAEIALRESEARFRFMAEYMPPKVFTARPDGSISYLSPQWALYTGRSPDGMDYDDWSQTVHPDDLEDNLKVWQRATASGEPFYFEHRLRRGDGTYRWHVSRANPMRDSTGTITEWIGSDTDIEELHQSRDLQSRLDILAEQREQLISTNRLKDEFIMLASHQLRTPATGVKQYVSMLLQGYSDDITEDQRAMLQHAYDSNERQIRTVDDILRVARIDAGQVSLTKVPCDLVQFLRGIVAEKRPVFHNRQQALRFVSDEETIVASIDTKLMRIVIENLLDNASKYSLEGKHTTIRVRKGNPHLLIEVKDNGIGICKKDMRQLFQKFSRIANPLSDTVTGTGLGLYWSKRIVELHEGTLDAASKISHGSTFSILLPVN